VVATRVRSDDGTEMLADMLVGFKALREKFTSRVIKQRPGRLEVIYIDGPMRDLDNLWHFRPLAGGWLRARFLRRIQLQEQDVRIAGGELFRTAPFTRWWPRSNARRRALRQQQLERAERRLKAHAGAILLLEQPRFGVGRVAAAHGPANTTVPTGLFSLPPPGRRCR
jgi:coenzyme Q-binding protein COQ10